MKKLILLSLAAAAASLPTAGYAAPSIQFDDFSGAFENDEIGAGLFDNTFTFNVNMTGNVSATITSIAISTLTDISFSSVTLNNIEFDLITQGTTEFRSINAVPVTSGTQTLRVRGTSQGEGSFAGTIAFAAQRVPEPGTMATMAVALTFLGGGLSLSRRNRRRTA